MRNRQIIQSVLTLIIMVVITTALFLYTAGYRLIKDSQNDDIDLTQTGMISAKSIPEGANVYIDGKLVTATNGTVSSLKPGKHTLKIAKKGFVEWQKEVEVFPELVTDITAILVSQTPRLEPLTNTGANYPTISPTLDNLAYFSNDEDSPGVWVIPLSQNGLSLFRADPMVVLEDSRVTSYSVGTSLKWSPDEGELLVGEPNDVYYLVDLTTNTAQSTSSPELTLEMWEAELKKERTDFVDKLDIPDDTKEIAVSPTSLWSPDEKKFLFTKQIGNTIEYRVYNMEKPIPVGENVDTVVLTTNVNDPQPAVSWYSDSYHLILTEMRSQEENKGAISLIRIDGTNKIEVYNNTLYSDQVFSSPGGDKLIILTSFKSGERTDLYTVGIR